MDTCYNCCEPGKGWFSTDERKWITRIRKLKMLYPELVTIKNEPETNDGCLVCTLPSEWLKLSPPKKMNLTDEQRAARAEALAKYKRSASSR